MPFMSCSQFPLNMSNVEIINITDLVSVKVCLLVLKLSILHLLLLEVIAHLFLRLFLLTTNKADIKIELLKCILYLTFSSLLPKGIAES